MSKNPLKCTQCKSHKFCRSQSITKGSRICDENRGILKPREFQKPAEPNAEHLGLLWALMQKVKRK